MGTARRRRNLAAALGTAAMAAFGFAYVRFEATAIQGAIFTRDVGAPALSTHVYDPWFLRADLWTWIGILLALAGLVAAVAYARVAFGGRVRLLRITALAVSCLAYLVAAIYICGTSFDYTESGGIALLALVSGFAVAAWFAALRRGGSLRPN